MVRAKLLRAVGLFMSLIASLSVRKTGRAYGNVAAHLDERRAEDELDAAMGSRHPVTSQGGLPKLTQQHPSAAA